MRPFRTCLLFALLGPTAALNFVTAPAHAADWIVAPSTYTHDPMTGQRVAQYTEIGPYYYFHRPDYMKSGYRNYRSTIQTGSSADNMHIVEEWGRPVIPYEQWRFPARPYGVPYDQWGPPFGGLGNTGYGSGGFLGGGLGGGGFLPNGPIGPGPLGPLAPGGWGPQRNYAQPYMDGGHYPSYDRHDRSDYYRSYP